MHQSRIFFLAGSLLASTAVVAASFSDMGISLWPNSLPVLAPRAGPKSSREIRREQNDDYCPEDWLYKHLAQKDKKFRRYEVYRPWDPEDGILCEYAISPENKAMVMLDIDQATEEEVDSCYRDILVENMKHKLGATNGRIIVVADIVNQNVRNAISDSMQAVGKSVRDDNEVTFKPGGPGWVEFVKENNFVTGILNTLCAHGKTEMGNAKLKDFIAVSRKNTKYPGNPNMHIITFLR